MVKIMESNNQNSQDILVSKTNLLVVDDDNTSIELVARILRDTYNIVTATSGEQALQIIKNYKPDLILLDIHMPHMNGFDLAKKLTQNEKTKNIPFIFLSSDDSDKTISQGFDLGALDFIFKPFDKKVFDKKFKVYIKYIKKNLENKINSSLVEQYKKLIDETSIVSKTDQRGIITFVNDRFCEISGYSKEELIGKSHNIVKHPDNENELFEELWDTIKNKKKTWSGEIKNKTKKGKSYWVHANISPVLDINGEIIEYIGIRTNISQQKKIQSYFQNQLKFTMDQFDESMHLLNQHKICIDQRNAILRTDNNNIITYVNKSFCKISKYSKEELIGLHCKEIRDKSHIESGDCKRTLEMLQNNKPVSIIFKNIAKDGTPFYMDTLAYPIQNINNKPLEHLHLMHDITEIVSFKQEIEDTQKEVVFTMGAIGETRSKETGFHVKRVAEYSYLLAILYGLDEKQATLLKQASPMHDIGKVGIPDSILNKPGKLTDKELEVMKTHSTLGYEMLKHSHRAILKTAATVAYTHHEKWDGSGYPNSLKGEEIPIEGRITAVADVFDALGHDRVYKKGWELEKILELFKEQKGKHFDPELIDLFMENLNDFLVIKKELEDN